MNRVDWNSVETATEFAKPTPGGYVLGVYSVEDVPEKEYIVVNYDFAEGDLRGYYSDMAKTFGNWSGRLIRSYKPKALPFFKQFKEALEASNSGYHFDELNLQAMRGKLFGAVLAEEEYVNRDGQVKTSLRVQKVCSVQDIKSGNFTVPDVKKLSEAQLAKTAQPPVMNELTDDGELPF